MDRDIIGDWGAALDDDEYGCALAALGTLETRGTHQYTPSDDIEIVAAAIKSEFKNGDTTVMWRGAHNAAGAKIQSWREPSHINPRVLADAWRFYLERIEHPRDRPRLAVAAAWTRRSDLFAFEDLIAWLGRRETGCEAVVLAPEVAIGQALQTSWHWPVRIGVPAGPEGETLLRYFGEISNDWLEYLTVLQPVGAARDRCDLLILPPGVATTLLERPRIRLRASFVVCLDDPMPWTESTDSPQARLRDRLSAAGVALVGNLTDSMLPTGMNS